MTTHPPPISRRPLQGSLAIGGLAAGRGLASCSNENRGDGGSQATGASLALPPYIPWPGVEVDLVGSYGVSDAVLAYPSAPQAATDGPLGDLPRRCSDVAQAQYDAQVLTVPTAVPNPSLPLFSETESRKGG